MTGSSTCVAATSGADAGCSPSVWTSFDAWLAENKHSIPLD
jgi:hypothetical protein